MQDCPTYIVQVFISQLISKLKKILKSPFATNWKKKSRKMQIFSRQIKNQIGASLKVFKIIVWLRKLRLLQNNLTCTYHKL